MSDSPKPPHYDGPVGGWGSLRGMAAIFGEEWNSPTVLATLLRQNKPHGFACVACAWPKPAKQGLFEFCENGAKATLWELTSRRCDPAFFEKHSVSELKGWSDYDLEKAGRLTHPMRLDAASGHYVPCAWEEAFAAIGTALKAIDPASAVFYASGRASLETQFFPGPFSTNA